MVDATLGLGGHTEAVLAGCALARVIGIDRDPRRARARRPSASRRTATGSPASTRVYDELPEVLADQGLDAGRRRCCSTSASPRMQLDVTERGFAYREDAPLDMRMDAERRPHRRRRPQHLSRGGAGPDPPGVRRGEVRPPDRRRGRRASGLASRSRRRPGWSSCCTPRSRRRPGGPAATPPSARSRRCGWRSTTSSPCCGGRCRPRSTRSGSAAGSSWSPTTRWRTGS